MTGHRGRCWSSFRTAPSVVFSAIMNRIRMARGPGPATAWTTSSFRSEELIGSISAISGWTTSQSLSGCSSPAVVPSLSWSAPTSGPAASQRTSSCSSPPCYSSWTFYSCPRSTTPPHTRTLSSPQAASSSHHWKPVCGWAFRRISSRNGRNIWPWATVLAPDGGCFSRIWKWDCWAAVWCTLGWGWGCCG